MSSVPHCRCGEFDFTPNVEAFETFGVLVCDDCAEDMYSGDFDDGQPDEAQEWADFDAEC